MTSRRASPRPSPSRALIIACGALVSLGGAALSALRPGLVSSADNLFFDAMARREHGSGPCRLPVVVALDDEALSRFGHWPWPRALFARLLDRLATLGPSAVGVDVLFPEREEPADGGQAPLSEGERALAKSLASGPFALGWEFTFSPATPAAPGASPPVALQIVALRPGAAHPPPRLWRARGAVSSLPELVSAAGAGGFLNAGHDGDGILRRMPLVIEHSGSLHPSLGLAVAAQALGARQAVLESSLTGGHVLRAGDRRVPLDSRGRLLLRYRCQDGPTRISAAAVLEGRLPADALAGRVVFVGAAATGLGETVSTPVAPALPGVVAHAIAAGNILERDFARQAPALLLAAVVLGIGFAGTIACLRLRALSGALVLAAAAAATWLASGWVFRSRGLVVSPALPVLTLAANFVVLTLVRAFDQERWARLQGEDLAATRDLVTESLASLAAIRDTETGAHILRTQRYVRILCEEAARQPRFRGQLTPRTIDLISKLAPIHDIGKVGVPDDLLHKPTMLTPEEREVVKKHALHGRQAIAQAETRVGFGDAEFLRVAKDLVYSHHERWDGSGYPEGLSGDRIPLAGRLMAIADVYDALVNLRVYKEALSHEEAVRFIREGRGTHFDPDLVDAFLSVQHRWRDVHRELSEAAAAPPPDPA
jgi:adenylate cyclase